MSKERSRTPKKKTHRRGEAKEVAEDMVTLSTRRKKEVEDLTVSDNENEKKYNKRTIESNWAKYKSPQVTEDDGDKNGPSKASDFSYLLKNASSDCSHFEFNSEKLWKKEEYKMPPNEIFNLDLNVLSCGLACVPFYERIGLDEKELTLEEKNYFDKEAEKNWKVYNQIREKKCSKEIIDNQLHDKTECNKSNKKQFINYKSNSANSKKLDSNPCTSASKTEDLIGKVQNVLHVSDNIRKTVPKEENKQTIFSEKDTLEDWLDTVLDD